MCSKFEYFCKAKFFISAEHELPRLELGAAADLFGKFAIVGSNDQRDTMFLVEAKEQLLYSLADAQVQRAGGLVGEQEPRL